MALAWYLWVWLWHFTPAAVHLPGASGFGWFFKYLTFYSYTFQMVQLFCCCWADLAQVCSTARVEVSSFVDLVFPVVLLRVLNTPSNKSILV